MKLATLRAKLAAIIEEQQHLDGLPRLVKAGGVTVPGISAAQRRRQVALCRQQARLENRIADLEFELSGCTLVEHPLPSRSGH